MHKFKDKEFAYWIGLVQADGSLRKRSYKNKIIFILEFQNKDKILVEAFQKICKEFLQRHPSIFHRRPINQWICDVGVTRLLSLFDSLDISFDDPPSPPKWAENDPNLFGAYLAGVIDGDGNIRIKRPKYPQCAIRITSGKKQTGLSESITKIMNCSVNIIRRHRKMFFKKENRIIEGTWYDMEFLVSSKTIEFVKSFILPHIKLNRKSKKLKSFIASKSH